MTTLLDALRTVPRVDAAEWSRLPWYTRWAVASRASVLVMTLTSCSIGGLLALTRPDFRLDCWVLALIGLLAAHAANNLVNDYVDTRLGIDSHDYFRTRYGTHVLESGLVTPAGMLRYIAATCAVAIAAGLLLVALRGGLILPLMAAGAIFVLFYTWPMKHVGLGEPAVLLVWGPLITGGSYYVACGEWSWAAAAIGSVYALGPTTVLLGKHIDKISVDGARGVRTLPVILGEITSRRLVQVLIVMQFVLVLALLLARTVSWTMVLVAMTAPLALGAVRIFGQPRPVERPEWFRPEAWPLWFAPHAFAVTRRFSMWFLAGLILSVVLRLGPVLVQSA
ncbi:MAG: prenyltransferase [Steroidobacteraceae bacterium]